MEGTGKPEYGKAVDIVTKSAIREMMLPAAIPVLTPIVIALVLLEQGATWCSAAYSWARSSPVSSWPSP